MPDHLGDDMRKVKGDDKEEPEIKGEHTNFRTSNLHVIPIHFDMFYVQCRYNFIQ